MEMTRKPTHPGHVFYEEVLKPNGIHNLGHFARSLGINPEDFAAVCSGLAPVTQEIAEKFGACTNTTPESWRQMQANLDEWIKSNA